MKGRGVIRDSRAFNLMFRLTRYYGGDIREGTAFHNLHGSRMVLINTGQDTNWAEISSTRIETGDANRELQVHVARLTPKALEL